MKLSDKIRILRKARGLSQEELGLSLSSKDNGVSRQSVSDWENGKVEPKLDNIRALAKLLNVSYDSLLDETLDFEDPEVLNRILAQGYIEKADIKKYYFKFWIIFAIILVLIALALIIPSLIIAIGCFKDAFENFNGDTSSLGKTMINRGYIFSIVSLIGLLLILIGVPLATLKAISERRKTGSK